MASSPFDQNTIDITSWLKKDRIEKKLDSKETSLPLPVKQIIEATSELHSLNDQGFNFFEPFINTVVLELLKTPEDLLKLNVSRRESLGRFLSELSHLPEPENADLALKKFVRFDRSETEHEALKQLFKQIALVQVAKALLLKSWKVHAHAELKQCDFKDLTASIEKDLRPFVHLQTSTAQLINRNFYSWYKLSTGSQEQLFRLVNSISDLSKAKTWLFEQARALSAETLGERARYSPDFYRSLWKAIESNKLLSTRSESLIGFSPTLRDGSLIESAPSRIEWMGFEPLSFELLFCEIRYLWEKPKNLPYWLKGSGLEMSMEQQSHFSLSHRGKQNVLKQMDSVSCAEVAVICEESLIRTQGKALAAQALRRVVDAHTVLKKLKHPHTTRGMYQACQALEKLRQGGTLFWAREEVLSEESGKSALQFILNQAKIVMIADLSAITCTSDRLKQDIPKVLYLLQKEHDLEIRKSHRPLLVKAFGNLSDSKAVDLLFDRLMSLAVKNDLVFPPEPFTLQSRVSPMDQREWEQHWFNPNDDEWVHQIEELKRNSIPLGALVSIRSPGLNPTIQNKKEPTLFDSLEPNRAKGFYCWVESSKNGNEIFTAPDQLLPTYLKNSPSVHYLIPMKTEWSSALQALIRSKLTRDWFEYSVERKKGAWIIKESDIKSIPVPKLIAQTLEKYPENPGLTPEQMKALSTVATDPNETLKTVENQPELKPHAFIIASEALDHLGSHQGKLFELVGPDEQILYPEFFRSVLTDSDMCSIAQHPLIRFTPTFSPHQAICQISVIKQPAPGILFATSKGLTQVLYIPDSWLKERCMEQLRALQSEMKEPSWSEIVTRIKVPKNPDQAQNLAAQILRAYSTEKMRRKELNHLLSVCLVPRPGHSTKVGLLQ